MTKRALGIVALSAVLLLGVLTGVAGATEGGGEFREYEEIVQMAGESGGQFLPDEYERPGFFDWFVFPLIAAGVWVTGSVVFRYLLAQPRFNREAEERSRRGR